MIVPAARPMATLAAVSPVTDATVIETPMFPKLRVWLPFATMGLRVSVWLLPPADRVTVPAPAALVMVYVVLALAPATLTLVTAVLVPPATRTGGSAGGGPPATTKPGGTGPPGGATERAPGWRDGPGKWGAPARRG